MALCKGDSTIFKVSLPKLYYILLTQNSSILYYLVAMSRVFVSSNSPSHCPAIRHIHDQPEKKLKNT